MKDLLDTYCFTSLVKQNQINELTDNKICRYSLNSGILTIGAKELQFEVLGTRSDFDNSWMWAWANTASNLSDSAVSISIELYEYGKVNGLDLLLKPKVNDDDMMFSKQISLIAVGMAGCSGCYFSKYDGGHAVLLVKSTIDINYDSYSSHIATAILDGICTFELSNHLYSIECMCKHLNLSFTNIENRSLSVNANGLNVNIDIDSKNKITSVKY